MPSVGKSKALSSLDARKPRPVRQTAAEASRLEEARVPVRDLVIRARATDRFTIESAPGNEGTRDLAHEEIKDIKKSAHTVSPQAGLIAHLLGATEDAPVLPESIEERLELYAPALARKVARMPPERIKVYHGGDASPEEYNPVLVNDANTYCAVDEEELSLARHYMTGKMGMDSLLWRSTDDPDRLTALRKAGNKHYGFLTEFSVPPELFGTAWEFRDNLMANDFLFATRIATYNLDKLNKARTTGEEEAALEWYSTSDFIKKFIPGDAVEELLALKRSKAELRHDCDEFDRIQTRNRIQVASRGIGEVDGFFFTHHEKMAGRDVCTPYFRYRDKLNNVRTLEIDQRTQIIVDGQAVPYSRKMISANERRLLWTLPGGAKIKIGKRAKVPEATATGNAEVSFGFSFDDSGDLQISITTR